MNRDQLDDLERRLRATLSLMCGCNPLDVCAVPGRNAHIEITLTPDQASALLAYISDCKKG